MSKFTEQALRVVSDAQDLARRRGDAQASSLHLLTSLYAIPGVSEPLKAAGLTDELLRHAAGEDQAGLPQSDSDALASLGLDVRGIEAAVDGRMGAGTFKDSARPSGGPTSILQAMKRSRDLGVGFSDDAKDTLRTAQAHGNRLGVKTLGPEVIALAVMDSPHPRVRDLVTRLDRATAISGLEAAAKAH